MSHKFCYNENCKLFYIDEACKFCQNFKEKPMSKVIFEITEEQAREIYRAGVFINPNGSMENEYVRMLKEKGYIRKSAVEEAEEMYRNIKEKVDFNMFINIVKEIIEKQHEAINELKAKLESK